MLLPGSRSGTGPTVSLASDSVQRLSAIIARVADYAHRIRGLVLKSAKPLNSKCVLAISLDWSWETPFIEVISSSPLNECP